MLQNIDTEGRLSYGNLVLPNALGRYSAGILYCSITVVELFVICLGYTNSGCGKEMWILMIHGDLPRQHPFVTTLRSTSPVPADFWQ